MNPHEEEQLEEVRELLELYSLEFLLDNSEYTLETIILHLLQEGLIESPEVKPVRG